MYTKITLSGGRRYLQLVEGFRDEAGKCAIGSSQISAGSMISRRKGSIR